MSAIQELYAYIAEEAAPGAEGLVAMVVPQRGLMAMVFTTVQEAAQARPIAEKLARQLEKRVKLVRFTVREELEIIEGKITVAGKS